MKNKVLLITGGTGSFGHSVLKRFINSDVAEIRVFSRDEKKQDDMRKHFRNKKLKFYIGDIRDPEPVNDVVQGADYIFHAAALKQVPSCEFHPLEAVKTNVIGTEILLNAAIKANVKKVVCLSTDKAVYPINAMGMSKALMEKVAIAKSRYSSQTVICITRYGNVMNSRGSVIPLFIEQILSGVSLSITDPAMTRFMMTLDDAVDLVIYAFEHGKNGEIFVQKSPACTIETLADALIDLLSKGGCGKKIIGTRHGEKLYESLLSREEMIHAKDLGMYFSISPDTRDLNYEKYLNQGDFMISKSEDYNSHNATRLDVEGIKKLLLKTEEIRLILNIQA